MPDRIDKKDLNILLTFMNEGLMIFEKKKIVAYANPKASALIGIKKLQGMKLKDVAKEIVEENGMPVDLNSTPVMHALKTGKSPPEKVYRSLITGRWMSGSSVPIIEDNGEINRAFVMFHDITDFKLSELSKEELMLEREKFYAMVTHDLKNPLTTITLAAALIRKTSPDLPLTLKHVETILKSTVFMSSLIDELIKLTSVQSKQMKLKYETVDFRDVLLLIEKHFELQLDIKRLRLQIHCVNLTCQCDKERLFQVMMNLVGNAIKFSNEGGVITIEVKESNSHFLISVKDTGLGIPKDKLKKIFDPYFQLKKEDAFKGHGLGLTIVKHIVEAHHGKVWAESTEGTGSSFHVMLPKFSESKDTDDTRNFGS